MYKQKLIENINKLLEIRILKGKRKILLKKILEWKIKITSTKYKINKIL